MLLSRQPCKVSLRQCSTCFTAAWPAVSLKDYDMLTFSGVPAEPGDNGYGAESMQDIGNSIEAADEALFAEAAFVEEAEQW